MYLETDQAMLEPGNRILISACLIGCKCNYKASAASVYAADDSFWQHLFEVYQVLPICPEQLGGMPTPRIPCELQKQADMVLSGAGKVINREGSDMTACFLKGAEEALHLARLYKPDLVVLKSRSPSCGIAEVYDGTFSGRLVPGSGMTAQVLQSAGFRLVDEARFFDELCVHSAGAL